MFNDNLIPEDLKVKTYIGKGLVFWYNQLMPGKSVKESNIIDFQAVRREKGDIYIQPKRSFAKSLKNEDNIVAFHLEDALSFLTRATEDQKNRFYDKAIKEYSSVISLLECRVGNKDKCEKEIYKAYVNRGHIYFMIGDMESAITDFDKAIDLDNGNPIAFGNRGQAYLRLDKYEQALLDLEKALDLDPHNTFYYHLKGDIYEELNQFDKAIISYTQAIEIDQYDEYSYIYRANLWFKVKNYDNALADVNKYIEMDPIEENGFILRAEIYTELERYLDAEADYRNIIENVNFEYKDAYYNLGLLYLKHLKKYKEAVKCFKKVIDLDPFDLDAYINRGNSYLELGDFDKASSDFKKVISLTKEAK